MKNQSTNNIPLLFITFILIFVFSAAVEARPSNKWRLHFDGQANNNGTIVLELTPESGQPITIQSEIEDGTKENKAADKVAQDIATVLGDGYKVKEQDGEEVKIKAKGDTPDFELKIISNSVDGLNVKTDRE